MFFFLRGWSRGWFLLCRISEISQKIFLSLLSVWQRLRFVKSHFVFTVISTGVHPPNPFFSNHMASAASVCYNESKQGERIESGRDKWAAVDLPIFDPDWGSKAFQNLLFPNSRNQSFSCLVFTAPSLDSIMPVTRGLPGCLCHISSSQLRSKAALMPRRSWNVKMGHWRAEWGNDGGLITSGSAPRHEERYLLQKAFEEFLADSWLESCSQTQCSYPAYAVTCGLFRITC